MKYFITDKEREGTCYHEFYKGKWDGETFWKSDSISIDDDFLDRDFCDTIREVVPNYDPYGVTEISDAQWKAIGEVITSRTKKTQEIYNEADRWLKDVFKKYTCFTILGI